MPGIWSALEARDHVIAGSKIIHDLAFAFIAPLQTKNYINHKVFIDGGKCTSRQLNAFRKPAISRNLSFPYQPPSSRTRRFEQAKKYPQLAGMDRTSKMRRLTGSGLRCPSW